MNLNRTRTRQSKPPGRAYTGPVRATRIAQMLLLAAAMTFTTAAQPAAAQIASSRPAENASATPDPAGTVGSVRIESPVFRLVVPFRTQKDGSRWQGSNCGPATLGMILDGFGIADQATDDLGFRAHTYQGTFGMRTGTGLEHVAHVAED